MQWREHRTSIILGLLCAFLLSAFWFFPSLAFIIFLSLLLQLVLRPLVDKLAKRIPRLIASILAMALFIAVFSGALTLITRSFVPTLTKFIADLPELLATIQNLEIVKNYNFLK